MNESISMLKTKLADVEAAHYALYLSKHLLEEEVEGNSSVTDIFPETKPLINCKYN